MLATSIFQGLAVFCVVAACLALGVAADRQNRRSKPRSFGPGCKAAPSAPMANAHAALFKRYDELLSQRSAESKASVDGINDAHLRWMCQTAIQELGHWPEDKASRWLGFIQGVMAARGYIEVSKEREHSRQLFHAVYQAKGMTIPASAGPGRPESKE